MKKLQFRDTKKLEFEIELVDIIEQIFNSINGVIFAFLRSGICREK